MKLAWNPGSEENLSTALRNQNRIVLEEMSSWTALTMLIHFWTELAQKWLISAPTSGGFWNLLAENFQIGENF